MTRTDLIVEKANITNARLVEPRDTDSDLGPGRIRVQVDRFALTSNNLSYAAAGEMLGYWKFFPTTEDGWGVVPAWGFATVDRSEHDEIAVGEEIFGFFPMARHLVMEPAAADEVTFFDRFEHRADLHPWYNRYYRTQSDPVTALGHTDLQPALWALFMTGWMLGRELAGAGHSSSEQVIIASASSKTAYSLAHTLGTIDATPRVVGLTSTANRNFVDRLGCYDTVITYDDIDAVGAAAGDAVFVDMSGNADVVRRVHTSLGERLVDSVRVGATHLGARGDLSGLPGPTPRFFFIPDVAEARAAEIGFAAYHDEFAAAWARFAPWAAGVTQIHHETGPEAIERAYRAAVGGTFDPSVATMLAYRE